MEEKIKVMFGRSFDYPDTIVIEEVQIEDYLTDQDGTIICPIYNGEVESWMSRTDMSCHIFEVDASKLEDLSQKYTEFIKATWDSPSNEEKIQQLKEEFLAMTAN